MEYRGSGEDDLGRVGIQLHTCIQAQESPPRSGATWAMDDCGYGIIHTAPLFPPFLYSEVRSFRCNVRRSSKLMHTHTHTYRHQRKKNIAAVPVRRLPASWSPTAWASSRMAPMRARCRRRHCEPEARRRRRARGRDRRAPAHDAGAEAQPRQLQGKDRPRGP